MRYRKRLPSPIARRLWLRRAGGLGGRRVAVVGGRLTGTGTSSARCDGFRGVGDD